MRRTRCQGQQVLLLLQENCQKYRLAIFQQTDFMQQQDSSHQLSYKDLSFNPDF